MRWIMPMKTMSLVGSTQNQVPAAPSQKKVPLPSGRLASGGSKTHGAVVAVAEAGAHDHAADAELPVSSFGGDVVGGHQLDGGGREDALAVEFAAC
jgi:hypothetical protein